MFPQYSVLLRELS